MKAENISMAIPHCCGWPKMSVSFRFFCFGLRLLLIVAPNGFPSMNPNIDLCALRLIKLYNYPKDRLLTIRNHKSRPNAQWLDNVDEHVSTRLVPETWFTWVANADKHQRNTHIHLFEETVCGYTNSNIILWKMTLYCDLPVSSFEPLSSLN